MKTQQSNKLISGSAAPGFHQFSIQGDMVDLQQYSGNKTLLCFFRYAECMFCNLRVHELILNAEKWKKNGLLIIAFFQSPEEDLRAQFADKSVPFPIIADPGYEVYRKYGVTDASFIAWMKGAMRIDRVIRTFALGNFIKFGYGKKTLIPADFLIDESGVIQKAFYPSEISGHISVAEIDHFASL